MEPLQIVLILLAAAGVWAVVELALVIRGLRSTIDGLNKTVDEVNGLVEEAQPIIGKLDETVENLQPAINELDPLLVKVGDCVDAVTADLLEVNGMLRDVSEVTGNVSSASSVVSDIADAASGTVQRVFGKKPAASAPERTLVDAGGPAALEGDGEAASGEGAVPSAAPNSRYFTYSSTEEAPDAE